MIGRDLQPRWYWYETSLLTITALMAFFGVLTLVSPWPLSDKLIRSVAWAAFFLLLTFVFAWGFALRKEGRLGDFARDLAESEHAARLAWLTFGLICAMLYLALFGFRLP